jgi:bacillithiol biosynthesis deacetylase BshB1
MSCDALVFAPHPDDAEIACGGALLLLKQRNKRVVVVDATRGEKGTRGDEATRAREAEAATRMLGLAARENLGLPDTAVRDDEASAESLVRFLRSHTPRLLLAPHAHDPHPDHVACAQIAKRAFFLAGLARFRPELGAPFRPSLLLRYPLHEPIEPTFCVDITAVHEQKQKVIACYASQLTGASNAHFVKKLDIQQRIEIRDRFYGARIGVAAAEPFASEGPLPLSGLELFTG